MKHINLEYRVQELEMELKEAKQRIKELEEQLAKKKKMPKGGNVHVIGGPLFKGKLNVFMSKVEIKVDKNGKEYKDWRKAMEYARGNKEIQLYATKHNVAITQKNLERWYKAYTGEIKLNKKVGSK